MAVNYDAVRRLTKVEERWLSNIEIIIDSQLQRELGMDFDFPSGAGYSDRSVLELRNRYLRAGWGVSLKGGNYGTPSGVVIAAPPEETPLKATEAV